MGLGRSFRFASTGAAVLGFMLVLAAAADAQVGVSINGSSVDINPPPIMQAGRVFVPLRGVFERLGASVVYSNGQINATGNGSEIALQIGSRQATINGQPQTIDVAPFIVGASTYVPLRFVSEALGAGVSWDETNQVVAITLAGAPPGDQSQAAPPSYAETTDWVSEAPPPIPDYDAPPVPDPNEIWVPGYWAWGPGGYYWVPGTWVEPPQPGLLWTPGYWGWQNGYYGWNPGYWATNVGFYGGIYYGGGYYGNGYAGGRWYGNTFRYNTAVTRVRPTIVNVYIDKTVVVNRPASRSSYNGGPGGLRAQPTAGQIDVGKKRHVSMTQVQQQHVQIASQDHGLLARVNGGKPPVVTAAQPLAPTRKPAGFVPITAQDKSAAQKLIVHRTIAPRTIAPAGPAVATTPAPVRPVTAAPRPVLRRPESSRPPSAPTARPLAPTAAPTRRPTLRPEIARPTPRPQLVQPTPRPRIVEPAVTAPPAQQRPASVQTEAPRPPAVEAPTPRPVVRTLPPRPRPTPKPKPTPLPSETPK